MILKEKRKKKQSKAGKVIKRVLLVLFVVLIILAGVFAYKVYRNGGGLQGFLAAFMGHDQETLENLEEIRFLLVGISGSEENYKLADSIMVCQYNPKEQTACLLSIPRDSYVGTNKKKAQAKDKINAVYRNGSNIEGMKAQVEKLTGLEIPHYVIIDTEALVKVVDAVGGIDFNVPINMNYDDETQNLHIELKAGQQKLNGKQAEGLVRFRHNNDGTSYPESYGDNDLGRMRTQKEFLAEAARQILKPGNIIHLNKLVQIAFDNIKTDISFDVMKNYVPYAVNFNTENLKSGVLPGEPTYANKVAIYEVNKKEAETVVQDLFFKTTESEGNTIAE